MPDVELTVTQGAAVDVTVSSGASVTVQKSELVRAALKDDLIHGRQHTVQAAALAAAYSTVTTRPVRLLVLGDSMYELGGFAPAIQELARRLTGSDFSYFTSPEGAFGAFTHPVNDGTPALIGIDGYGTVLASGDDLATTGTAAIRRGDTLRIYYTARQGSGDFAFTIDGDPYTIDGSQDEEGNEVSVDTPSQMYEVTGLDPDVNHELIGAATGGSFWYESDQFIDGGFITFGGGRSGQSTQEAIDDGNFLAFAEAMDARGEPPDAILYASDTADGPTAAAVAASVDEMYGEMAALFPLADHILWIPPAHGGNGATWPDYVAALRNLAIARGMVIVNAYDGLGGADKGGDLSDGEDPRAYSGDGVHFSTAGARANSDLFLSVVMPNVREDAGLAADITSAVAAATFEGLADVDVDVSELFDGEVVSALADELVRGWSRLYGADAGIPGAVAGVELVLTVAGAPASRRGIVSSVVAFGAWNFGTGAYEPFQVGTPAGGNDAVTRDFMRAGSLTVTRSNAASPTLTGGAWVYTGTGTTWTLPTIASSANMRLWIKHAGSGTLTVQRASSNNIFGDSNITSFNLAVGESVELINDGSVWQILSRHDVAP